jgi:hypothetical protein
MDASLQRFVVRRARGQCEYCRIPQGLDAMPFCFDHIIAQKHHGLTTEGNLAWCCFACNSHKGPNIAGIDLETSQVVPLFNPRLMSWDDHFTWNGPELIGRTAIGSVTIDVLKINHPERIDYRRLLEEEGMFPPNS